MQTMRNQATQPDLLLVMLLTIAAIVCSTNPTRPPQGTALGYYIGQQIE